ncbi:MAG: UDP-N-acetylglucosamine diphosphorylase [Clostridia bacterium]|nr:UDP-N-acetylglucosamine diphosphorylase [Clostridia bacterium]
MNYIYYRSDVSKEELLRMNIVIDSEAKIADGVKISSGVCVLKESKIGQNVEIGSNSIIENTVLEDGVKIQSSVVKDSHIGNNTSIGPFAHIRNNTIIGKDCRIGNFVEIKKSIIGDECKIAHLTYVGDASMGRNCNIGCGVVFCNYNGEIKQSSNLGDNVFIGSNVNIIAPVNIGDWAYVAAGSTINKNIEPDEFSIARSRQENKKNFINPYKNNKKH